MNKLLIVGLAAFVGGYIVSTHVMTEYIGSEEFEKLHKEKMDNKAKRLAEKLAELDKR